MYQVWVRLLQEALLKDKPRAGGNVLITTSFRVKVTGAIGDTIILGTGHDRYKKINSGSSADTVVNAIQYKILISNNDPICPNAIGRNFVTEAGGLSIVVRFKTVRMDQRSRYPHILFSTLHQFRQLVMELIVSLTTSAHGGERLSKCRKKKYLRNK